MRHANEGPCFASKSLTPYFVAQLEECRLANPNQIRPVRPSFWNTLYFSGNGFKPLDLCNLESRLKFNFSLHIDERICFLKLHSSIFLLLLFSLFFYWFYSTLYTNTWQKGQKGGTHRWSCGNWEEVGNRCCSWNEKFIDVSATYICYTSDHMIIWNNLYMFCYFP